jgi:hypothetical protein
MPIDVIFRISSSRRNLLGCYDRTTDPAKNIFDLSDPAAAMFANRNISGFEWLRSLLDGVAVLFLQSRSKVLFESAGGA